MINDLLTAPDFFSVSYKIILRSCPFLVVQLMGTFTQNCCFNGICMSTILEEYVQLTVQMSEFWGENGMFSLV